MPDHLTPHTPRLPAVERICETCGTAFRAKAAVVRKGGGRFCSRACFGATKGEPPVQRLCRQCGASFTVWAALLKSGRGEFCSRACKYAGTTISQPVLCLHCGTTFTPRSVGALEKQAGIRHLYCSRVCYEEVRSGADGLNDRFFAKVHKTLLCWPWIGNRRREYGEFWKHNERMPAHRFAWEMVAGPVPEGMMVLHDCPGGDNPLCVRNDGAETTHVINGIVRPQFGHLWIGTQADNMADMQLKGRSGQATLTPQLVIESRRRYAAGEVNQSGLIRELGMSRAGVRHMLLGKTWKHI